MPTATEERRQHKRYTIENSVAVSDNGVFQVSDVSRGGFCFKCPPYTAISDFWETDILTPIEQLKDYPVKRVWVSLTENHTHEALPTVVGAKFGKLTKEQKELLSRLIETLSHHEGPDQ